MKEREYQEAYLGEGLSLEGAKSFNQTTIFITPTLPFLTLSSTGQRQRFSKVPVMFLVNLGPNTSLSDPNWCLDCLTMESTTYRPATLYSGLHWREEEKTD